MTADSFDADAGRTYSEPAAATPGQAFREALHERWAAQGRCIDTRPYDQLPEGDRDDLEAAVQAAMDAGAPKCPNGCGCRLGTEQADQRDCACDGLCCYDEIEVSELFAERDRLKAAIAAQDARPVPELAAAMRKSRRYLEALHRARETLDEGGTIGRRLSVTRSIVNAALEGK